MKLHLLSDIHSEFIKDAKSVYFPTLLAEADTLVMAGDIAMGRSNVVEALRYFSSHYKDVLYIPGNHEYYHKASLDAFEQPEFLEKLPENVTYLNARSTTIGHIQFHGATLWTNFNNDDFIKQMYMKYINDYRRIHNATPEALADIYRQHAGYLKLAYENRDRNKKQVFITHFLPDYACVSSYWRNQDIATSALNSYFSNNLGSWIETLDNSTWLFGHTHDPVDVTIGTTRCYANPKGYPKEKQAYSSLVLDI
jgi:predicted phosphodiesterase